VSADVRRHLERLERIVSQLREDIGELGEPTRGAGRAERRSVEVKVLDRLVDLLGAVASQQVVRLYIDSLPARIISVVASGEASCGARAQGASIELRLASELVGAMAMADWCRVRDGEPPMTGTLDELQRWLLGVDDGD
jgi:hypothetical protein